MDNKRLFEARRAKVAIVDANADDIQLLQWLFQRRQITAEIQSFFSANVFLSALDDDFEPFIPDLVICDMDLPDISGDQLIRSLQKDRRFQNTLFISTMVLPMEGNLPIRSSKNRIYVQKPLTYRTFANIIEHADNFEILHTSLGQEIKVTRRHLPKVKV